MAKCKYCKSEVSPKESFKVSYMTTPRKAGVEPKKVNKHYCSESCWKKEEEEVKYWRECQYGTDHVLSYPIVNNARNRMLMEIINSGISRKLLASYINEKKDYIKECLAYRQDIDKEYQKLCYMFAIIKAEIKDYTIKKQEVNIDQSRIQETTINEVVDDIDYRPKVKKTNNKGLLSIIRG